MMDTINDGTLYLQGACMSTSQARYAADHGVTFPDLLNIDEGQLQHTKLCLLSSKTIKLHGTEMVRGTSVSNDSSYC